MLHDDGDDLMEIKIRSETENSTLSRKEIECYITSTGSTPSIKEVTTEVSKKMSMNPDLVVVVKLEQPFGTRRQIAYIHYYEDEKKMRRYEPKYLLDRKAKRTAAEKQEVKASEVQ